MLVRALLSWSCIVDLPASISESSPRNVENTDTTENTETENSETTGPTENTDTPASDNSENSITDNTTSDLLVDLPSTKLTPASEAADLDNSEQDNMDQDSSDSTLLDETYSSATEEETMELFSDTPPSHPSANGRKPAKISQAFIPPRKPTAPKLVTGKPSREHSPDSDDSPAPKNPNTGRTNKHKHGKKNRDRRGGGAGRGIALPLFCWHIFSRAPVDMENVLVELLYFSLKGGR